MNRADTGAVLATYHDACVTEQAYLDDEPGAICRGRAAQQDRLTRFFAAAEGALGGGAVIFVDGRVVLIRRRYEPLAGHALTMAKPAR